MEGVPVAEAAAGWAGPEAVVFAVIGVLAFIGVFGLVWHLKRCDASTALLHQRISALKDDVSKLQTDVAYVRATLAAHLDRFREEQKQ